MASTRIDRSLATSTPADVRPLWLTGALAAIAAAAGAVVVALGAKAIDVPLEVDGDEIPIPGFALVTLFWSAVGVGMAYAFSRWAKRPARTFVVTTVVLTALSLGPVVDGRRRHRHPGHAGAVARRGGGDRDSDGRVPAPASAGAALI